jgi:hypothetical protein
LREGENRLLDYAKYEADCVIIRRNNSELLNEFEAWQKAKKLSGSTINNHIRNIDFYINEYLLYEEIKQAKDGVRKVGMFLGDWFIRKAMWSSVNQIKNNATSLKKFYSFMFEKGFIAKEELDYLNDIIKEQMPKWLAAMEHYDDLYDEYDDDYEEDED